eukprot:3652234-Rhodomonas_salina.1
MSASLKAAEGRASALQQEKDALAADADSGKAELEQAKAKAEQVGAAVSAVSAMRLTRRVRAASSCRRTWRRRRRSWRRSLRVAPVLVSSAGSRAGQRYHVLFSASVTCVGERRHVCSVVTRVLQCHVCCGVACAAASRVLAHAHSITCAGTCAQHHVCWHVRTC